MENKKKKTENGDWVCLGNEVYFISIHNLEYAQGLLSTFVIHYRQDDIEYFGLRTFYE